eukprot:GEMP01077940.1.p1 GENE.GEMP01077940.1~~GEMP01077940.1.p1  ORF type:complete len:307 (+),score=61.03 GEMP01077940.1:131-1051(+)
METVLGFLEEEDAYLLQSRFFPSKAGGKPAWLIPRDFPSDADLRCDSCGHSLSFLLQISASRGDDDESCFHRIVLLFVCGKCKDQVKVYRSKLPRENMFYSAEEPDDENDVIDPRPVGEPSLGLPFPEFEVECDEDAEEEEQGTESDEEDMQEEIDRAYALSKYRAYLDKVQQRPDAELDESEMNFFDEWRAKHCVQDEQFKDFQQKVKQNPRHVLRYGGSPLWFCKSKMLSGDEVPPCSCGSRRSFEFQIMPQLISLLKAELEWGVVCVYSCDANCSDGSYIEEFAYVQPEPAEWANEVTGIEDT